ncbi:hypothetical protein [Paenibacillus wulumuqiensis]|uniref:hypothetical protein n=1 Tax=Paenibacillus wulumuqiensis TaxID=1567107 RepID=UPI000619083E|nr:hypothetical protein [Paenibacillus wulumuqiensis]
MEINQYFRHFAFTPKLIVEERKKVEQKFQKLDQEILKQRGKYMLPRLLEIIRSTPIEKIQEFALQLKRIEIKLLISEEYPFPQENPETIRKINWILTNRYTSTVGRAAWSLFQHNHNNEYLQELLKQTYHIDQFSFLVLNETLQHQLKEAMNYPSGLVKGLVHLFVKSDHGIEMICSRLKIKKDAQLQSELIYNILKDGLVDDQMIQRNEAEYITSLLERYPMNEYKQLIKNYFESREYKQFHTSILNQAIVRLRDPRERKVDWEFLSDKAMEQVMRWLLQSKLQQFFNQDTNSERFDYWKRFIDYMYDVELIDDPMIAFIYFDNFVVVEYGDLGAAYFYYREGFEQYVLPKLYSDEFRRTRSKARKESMFKITDQTRGGVQLYINKLSHMGAWQYKFDRFMSQYLNHIN